jgi:AbrB family looped-hinge helix DNA binding protein
MNGSSMKTRVCSKGRIVLPAEIRRQDGIRPGQEFDIERPDSGDYRLKRSAAPNDGVVDWLLACPEKGFFVPICGSPPRAFTVGRPQGPSLALRTTENRYMRT